MNALAENFDFDNLVTQVQALEKELTALVQDRDELLYHVCPYIKTEYMLKIGKLEYSIFDCQCKILRTKRKIKLIQVALNREELYFLDEIEKQLDREYQEYTEKLFERQKEIENARLHKSNIGELLTKEETHELKKLYMEIVKKLHPDINPDTSEEQHGHFIDAVNAYKNADLAEMRIIHLLLSKTDSAVKTLNEMDKLKTRKERLLNEKNRLLNEIQRIKDSFPYNVKHLFENNVELQKKIDELSALLIAYQEQSSYIESRLEILLKVG
jgi:hypothetical protein